MSAIAWACCLFFSLAGYAQHAGEQPILRARYTHQVWNTSNGLPQDTVRQFLQTRDGYLWMATDGGLVRFDGIDFAVYDRRNTPEMQSDLINALIQDRDGKLWIATSNGLLLCKDNSFVRFTTRQGLPSDAVLSLHLAPAGEVCAVTPAGAACLAAGVFTATGSRSMADEADPSLNVEPRIKSPDGTTWAVTAQGLSSTRDGVTTQVPLPEGFTGSDIRALYVDREGDLWIGSENSGATILLQPPFNTIGKKDGLGADQVRSIAQAGHKDLWFGTSAGLSRLHDGRFTTFGVAQGLASNEIIATAASPEGDVWAGTPDGLSHLGHGHITTFTASDGLPDDDIRSLLVARDHSLWIGTTHGLAHLQSSAGGVPSPKNQIHTWTTSDGLPSNIIGSLLEDSDGSLWAGTRAGLAHLQDGKVRAYGAGQGLKSTIITALGKDSGGTLWVGTSGGGLYEWKSGRLLQAQTSFAGELPDSLYSVLRDVGSLWLSSPDGIYRISEADLHAAAESHGSPAHLSISHFDVADGLRISDCSSGGHPEALRGDDGRLYFATSKGVSMIDPSAVNLQPKPPPVVLEQILIDDSTVRGSSGDRLLRIAAGHERVAFHYAGLSFAAPFKVRYRYQLERFDRGWIDAGSRRTAYYTNIPPGHYHFRVEASTDGATWSEQAAGTSLSILPHYYQTWWFYSLLLIMLALLAWQLYLYRLRQVELRFNAVLAERGRIAREIHDTLAQDIVAISVQLDLVSRLLTLSVDKARDQLAATRDLVRRSLAEARSSIWDLRSQSAGNGDDPAADLPTRVREVARKVVADAPLKLNLQITGTYRPSSRDQEDELLRIAQEAVTNAVRHAQAQTIDVSLSYHASGVDLRVQDDGRGFVPTGQPSGPPGHYGLRGMHERAGRAHARLTVESSPGSGTTVIAKARIR